MLEALLLGQQNQAETYKAVANLDEVFCVGCRVTFPPFNCIKVVTN